MNRDNGRRRTCRRRPGRPGSVPALVLTLVEILAVSCWTFLANALPNPWRAFRLGASLPGPAVGAGLAVLFYGLDLAVLFQEKNAAPQQNGVWLLHLVPGLSALLRTATLLVLAAMTGTEILLTGIWNAAVFLAYPVFEASDRLAVASGRMTDGMDRFLAALELAVEAALSRLGPAGRPFPALAGWKTAQSEI